MLKTAKLAVKHVIVELKKIKEHPKNPKRHPKWHIEQLRKRIDIEGYNQEIIIDEKMTCLKGWGRVLALIEDGYLKAEVGQISGLTEQQKLAMLIADNKVISNEYDLKLLSIELPKLQQLGLDTGFSEKEIKDIMMKVKEPKLETQQAVYDMSPRLYEHYNYILLFFTNEMDYKFAKQKLGLKTVQDRMKPGKVGTLRAIDGMQALKILQESKDEIPDKVDV